ncbi:ribosome assembly RNA-binding protein YhbY [Nannocystaceae bacterium ST9]
MPLTSHQRQHLKGLAHPLRPIVQLGNAGITEGVLAAIADALQRHELIKVQMPKLEAASEREAMSAALVEGSGAELVQVIGRMVVLYQRRKKDLPDKPRIELPKG